MCGASGRADTPPLAVKVPNAAKKVAKDEFGASFMTPIMTRYECTEHVHKGIAKHAMFLRVAGTLLPSAVAATACGVSLCCRRTVCANVRVVSR